MLKKIKDSSYIKGSKVPISLLIDYISDGYSLTEFLSAYPWVKKSNAKRTLEQLKEEVNSSNYAL